MKSRLRRPLISSDKNSSWFEPTSITAKKPTPVEETEEENEPEGALDLICHLARNIAARRPTCRFDDVSKRFVLRTTVRRKSSVVEARVERDLRGFKRLRTELMVMIPQLSITMRLSMIRGAPGGESDKPALRMIPSRTLKRASTRRARCNDVLTLSSEGTVAWLKSKEALLEAWLADTLSLLEPLLAFAATSSAPSHRAALARTEGFLTTFLLCSAKVSVCPADRDARLEA